MKYNGLELLKHLSLAFGPEVFAQFLNGAAEADALAKNEDLLKNPALLEEPPERILEDPEL